MVSAREDFDLLCKEGDVSGPIDEETIARVETELGVIFPTEYRELLRAYGAVLAPNLEVYGVLPKEKSAALPVWQDVVSVTNELRGWRQAGSERQEFIPISEDGTGIYFYIDTSASPETKICAIGPGIEKEFKVNLFSFLMNLSRGNLSL